MHQESSNYSKTLPRPFQYYFGQLHSKILPKIFPHLFFSIFSDSSSTIKHLFLFVYCVFVCAVDTGVNEGEPVEEFAQQYREPEPEEPYREQELPEGFEDGKFNLIL